MSPKHKHGESVNGGSSYYSSAQQQQQPVEARRLELSLNEADGSLQTAPLFTVLLATTGALYSDLYNMAQGEIDVVTPASSEAMNEDNAINDHHPDGASQHGSVVVTTTTQRKKERMSALSFAQRRHELAWRLAVNAKRVQQVAALTAAGAATPLARHVSVASTALQHTRQAWVQADEAQDALYFFHAQLFPARRSPHDVYAACDLLVRGRWYDLPEDLQLQVDPYETSREATWGRWETDQRWQLAVRDKLVRGEVGLQVRERATTKCLWKVSIKGGLVKLTHGTPKVVVAAEPSDASSSTTASAAAAQTSTTQKLSYPLEALLTVLPDLTSSLTSTTSSLSSSNSTTNQSTSEHQWTLLSVAVHVQAKTGEFHHQLETSNRQRYDLHRLAASAMSLEESSHSIENNNNNNNHDNSDNHIAHTVARPLQALFDTLHTFQLAWQLELLSAQAQALRRGVWATAAAGDESLLSVTPVQFETTATSNISNNNGNGQLAVHFWKVDDAYGPPSIGELRLEPWENGDQEDFTAADETTKSNSATKQQNQQQTQILQQQQQLTLAIHAVPNRGILVSMSGARGLMEILNSNESRNNNDALQRRKEQLRLTVGDLLEATSNPFALSASDALLAATKLCAELKCQAVVRALSTCGGSMGDEYTSSILPSWMSVDVNWGSIAVAARVGYHGLDDHHQMNQYPNDHNRSSSSSASRPILFQIMCDARTGSFIHTFPRSMQLLRLLASGADYASQASEPVALRIASLPPNRRGRGARHHQQHTSNRVVRDAFESLQRSLNLLGQRVGVGGDWDDLDDQSVLLRERAIRMACGDVRAALIQCCSMAVLYGLVPLALGVAVGLDAVPDM